MLLGNPKCESMPQNITREITNSGMEILLSRYIGLRNGTGLALNQNH